MNNLLSEHPILLLFLVAAFGYLIGSIKINGGSLGVAAVLFTGLAMGAINPAFQIPDIIFLLGLAMFVYSLGLRSGPAFFNSYKKNGIRDFIFIISMLICTGLLAMAVFFVMDFSAATVVGMYTGSTTNTAAMAGIIEFLSSGSDKAAIADQMNQVAVGYTYSYPMGVLGAMIAIIFMEKLFKIDYKKELETLRKDYPVGDELTSVTLEVRQEKITGQTIRDLLIEYAWTVNFGRVEKNGKMTLADYNTKLELGDHILVVGTEEEITKVENVLGGRVNSSLAYDRRHFDVRRIFISNPEIAGQTIASLNLQEKFRAVITRIRRGDIDMLARTDTILELGDRIRFIASRKDLQNLSKYFGDSYQRSSEVNVFTFGLGIALGLLLGSIDFSFGPSFSFKLGYAGGPLIVGLILGTLRRTGPVVWTLPYGANVTLEQIGLIFLLSAVGVKSGNAFIQSLSSDGLLIFLAASVVSLLTAFITLLVGYKLLKMPFSLLLGMVSNQPAILEFARNRSGNRVVDYGFSMVFPIALIMKIVIAQILFIFLNSM